MEKYDTKISVGDRIIIYPRGKSRIWTAEFHHNGTHRRKSLQTKRKDIAMQRAGELAGQIESGEFQNSKKSTAISNAVESYLSFLKSQGRAKRTMTRYRGELNTFADYAVSKKGIRRMAQISMSFLDDYRAHRLEDHDIATIYHETVVIKQFFKWSRKRALIAVNPIADYELQKPRRKERRAPTLEQVHQILAQCTPRRKAEIAILAFTGMRSGEAQGLRREDVNLRTGWIDVHSQIHGPTKTEGSVRAVPIHPILFRLLKTVPQDGHALFFTAEPSSHYPEGGRPINTKRLNDYFKAAALRTGIEGFTLHSLRHFFKTFVINAGVPREMADRWMGHVDGSVSAMYYHVHDDRSKAFMESVPFDNQENN